MHFILECLLIPVIPSVTTLTNFFLTKGLQVNVDMFYDNSIICINIQISEACLFLAFQPR